MQVLQELARQHSRRAQQDVWQASTAGAGREHSRRAQQDVWRRNTVETGQGSAAEGTAGHMAGMCSRRVQQDAW